MNKLTKEEIENLIYKEKLGKYEAANRLKVCFTTLDKYMAKYGIKMPEKYDLNEIIALYTEKHLNAREIERKIDVKHGTVIRLLKKNGIEIRRESNSGSFKKNLIPWNKTNVEEDKIEEIKVLFRKCVPIKEISAQLDIPNKAVARIVKELKLVRPKSMQSRNQYDDKNDAEIVRLYEEGKSTTEIGKIMGLNHYTILNHLEHCGIQRRTLSESQYAHNNREKPKDLDDYEKMYDLYIVNRLSKKELGEIYNVDGATVGRALKKLGIQIRGCSEAKIGVFAGEKHPNWQGGKSGLYMRIREYFRFYLAKPVLKRDKHTCQLCGSKKKLHVHHIRTFKDIFNEILSEHPTLDVMKDQNELFEIMKNDERMNDLDNLITYCKDCHLYKIHGYKKKIV